MKVHLVDGTFELFRCFHGAPRATTADGREVGALRGLVQTLARLLRGQDVTHVAVAFDRMAPGRRGPAVDAGSLLRSQATEALEVVRALGIVLWPVRGARRLAAALAGRRDEAILCRDLSLLHTDLRAGRRRSVAAGRRVRHRRDGPDPLRPRRGALERSCRPRGSPVGGPVAGGGARLA